MDGRDTWWSSFELAMRQLLDPDNPFIPWLLMFDLVLLVAHLTIVYWVYRDALVRYNRGAPWAVLALLLPVGGWLFYLLYRQSPLVQFDRIEAELFDESEHEWTDYDAYRANQGSPLFAEISSFWRKPEGEGYSPWVKLSRMRELRKTLTPEQKRERAEQRKLDREEKASQRRQRREELREQRRRRARDKKERTTLTARHGFTFRMSDRGQRRLQRKLEVLERLKLLPREDAALEELIYQMEYAKAMESARASLAVAQDVNDQQGVITYKAYIKRLAPLLAESSDPAPRSPDA